MVGYNNRITQEKPTYERCTHRPVNAVIDSQYSSKSTLPYGNRFSNNEESIDRIVHSSASREKPIPEKPEHLQQYKYDMTQPIWFYKIIEKLNEKQASRKL